MPSIDICLASSLSSAVTRRRPSAPRRRAASTCATSAEVLVSLAILRIYAALGAGATLAGCGSKRRPSSRRLRDDHVVLRSALSIGPGRNYPDTDG